MFKITAEEKSWILGRRKIHASLEESKLILEAETKRLKPPKSWEKHISVNKKTGIITYSFSKRGGYAGGKTLDKLKDKAESLGYKRGKFKASDLPAGNWTANSVFYIKDNITLGFSKQYGDTARNNCFYFTLEITDIDVAEPGSQISEKDLEKLQSLAQKTAKSLDIPRGWLPSNIGESPFGYTITFTKKGSKKDDVEHRRMYNVLTKAGFIPVQSDPKYFRAGSRDLALKKGNVAVEFAVDYKPGFNTYYINILSSLRPLILKKV